MNIDRVRISGLFDTFDHDLAFQPGERIMIIVGPNGFGKTTTLRLINALFNQPISSLAAMPFREIEVSFDGETCLVVKQVPVSPQDNGDHLPLEVTCDRDGKTYDYRPRKDSVDDRALGVPISAIEEFIPSLDRVGAQRWLNLETGRTLDLAEVVSEFGEHFPTIIRDSQLSTPDWLKELLASVSVRLVSTERLTRHSRVSRPWRRSRAINATRTVKHYSDKLAEEIRKLIAEYGALSQSLDRTFPARLVSDRQQSSGSTDSLREDLRLIDQKRLDLEEAGLLAREHTDLDIPDLGQVDEAQRSVLAVFAEDTNRKLAVFDELYKRVSVFKRIVNSRFIHKQVAVYEGGLRATRDDGHQVELTKLSSGEQHELVMLYELLFRAKGNSLILIDEPEISLHVDWQERWINDLEETAALSDFRAIVATHSPEIIGNRFNLSVELGNHLV